MSPPPHREKDAKVEGRDPLETAPKETMAAFDALTTRLLKVPMSEVREQQRLYEETRPHRKSLTSEPRKKLKEGIKDAVAGKTKLDLERSKSRLGKLRETQKP